MGSNTVSSESDFATDAEVESAIKGLSDADAVRLRKIATFRASSLRALGLGMDADDLLQEAIMRTVNGALTKGEEGRRWKKAVPFVRHLDQTMRSIASHAREDLKDVTVVAASQEDGEGKTDGIALVSRMTDAERLAAAREQLDIVSKKFADDDLVGLVVEGLSTGMKGPEIQKDLGITETQFESTMTKLRRGVDRKGGWRP